MKLQILAAACAAVVTASFATAALADEAITAKLQAPVAAKTKFIAGGAIFNCEGDTCVALTPTSQTFAASACKTVAKNAGLVASFSNSRKALDADKLTACNLGADSNTQVAKR
jgi:hypothetical protein